MVINTDENGPNSTDIFKKGLNLINTDKPWMDSTFSVFVSQ